MGKHFAKYLLALALTLIPLLSRGQGQVYTRKAKLEDFASRTTKVVLTGMPVLDIILKEEISSRWRISPYEFCTAAEYERFKNRNLYYFLRFAKDSDFMYLIISKGGFESGEDSRTVAFDVLKMPVAPSDNSGGQEFIYMPAFIDIAQDFMMKAIESDRVAYGGLKTITSKRSTRGRLIYLSEEGAGKAFETAEKQAISGIVILPAENGARNYCYKILIGSDDHLLYYYRRQRILSKNDRGFTATDKIHFKGKVVK